VFPVLRAIIADWSDIETGCLEVGMILSDDIMAM
jgi:hypothetical protein